MGTFALPGQTIMPKSYGEAMVLYTAGDPVRAVVDGAPPGPNGRLFTLDPDKPKKVPYEAGRFILEHLAYTGVVRVHETETDTGVEYDIEGAKRDSLALLEQMDNQRFMTYVNDMVTDYIARSDGKSKAVPEPPPPIMAIIKRRGYDLKSYGIVPLGWQKPEADPRVAQLQDELLALRQQISELTAKKKG